MDTQRQDRTILLYAAYTLQAIGGAAMMLTETRVSLCIIGIIFAIRGFSLFYVEWKSNQSI